MAKSDPSTETTPAGFEEALKAYGAANLRLKCIEAVNVYGKTPEERLELDRAFGLAVREAVRAKYALDEIMGPPTVNDYMMAEIPEAA